MTRQDVLVQIERIFQENLKKESVRLEESMACSDVDGWNSLAHMMIIAGIEKYYSIKFNFREVVKLKTIVDICDAVSKKTA